MKYAARLRAEIQHKIELAQFDYAAYFPNSKKLQQLGCVANTIPTFNEMADRWLIASSHLMKGTLTKYQQALDRFWRPTLGNSLITEIKYSQLAAIIGKIDWPSAKHRNNSIIPLRRIFNMAILDEVITNNPAAKIPHAKVQPHQPDPLTLEEVNLVLEFMHQRYPEQIANYFEFAFFSGLRVSELIALKWIDIDFHQQTARIHQAKVLQEMKSTKTFQVRDVELNSRALAALQRQKAHTFMLDEFVFHNPYTNEPYHDDRTPRRSCWNPTLKALGLRHRNAYQTRHTFATLNLMAGANPMWVARQLGHNSMQMLLKVYSKWIDQADKAREKNKLESMLGKSQTTQTARV